MQSFIIGRTQTIHHGGSVSRRARLRSGIAQGSVLGPILYVLYTADVQTLVKSFGFRVHLYVDDTEFHDSCKSTHMMQYYSSPCYVRHWGREGLDAIELVQTERRQDTVYLARNKALQINSMPANEVVNNLGVYFDPELLMERQVDKLCQVCYFHLRRLKTIRGSLTKESLCKCVLAIY